MSAIQGRVRRSAGRPSPSHSSKTSISRKMCRRARSMVRLLSSRTAVLRKRMGGSRTGCQSPIWRRVCGIHVSAGLARIKQHHKHHEEHHVAGQGTEDKGAGAIENLAWAAPGFSPVVVASTAPAPGRPAVNRWLAPGSGRLPFDFGRDGRKDGRHRAPREDEVTLTLSWTHANSEEQLRLLEIEMPSHLKRARSFLLISLADLRAR